VQERDRFLSHRRETSAPLPITPFLKGEGFDPETRRVLGVALEMTCAALRTDDVKRGAIANKIIALAKAGERNADLICEQVLRDIVEQAIANKIIDLAKAHAAKKY
jgi:hypothetical protein